MLPQRPLLPASTPSTLAPTTYSSCHVDGPYIAMTFDDGPSVGNTIWLLDILKQRNIKVTFFIIGPNVVALPEIARRALAEGHVIGNPAQAVWQAGALHRTGGSNA